ncbi:hypothetical protein FE784_14905 [Paenibacillus hemerocallicola]|jgi:hypothetical protein|uniref:Uncharacterized protein n=1 Tax=Paenibacillus hemerocallicola TaxID=1172614 RepID=A0A5C4TAN2_9BACL|nr:hypothetical protein [Paenibacillus hemerocallicola]TNJ65507.1 hypothetical protein FE784_14905 [Paenibacillus hemerocallicola]
MSADSSRITRRKLLAAIGMTGVAAAAGGILSGGDGPAQASSFMETVTHHMYGPGGNGGAGFPELILVADSVEELLDLPPNLRTPGRIVFIAGYGAAGDGGEKFLRWVPDSAKPSSGAVHDPFGGDGTPGRWETIVLGRIRAEALGAVGPDPTDGVAFAFASGFPVRFAGTYPCRPFSVSDAAIDAEFGPEAGLVFVHDNADSAVFDNCSGSIQGMRVEDAKDAVGAGILVTLRLNGCKDMTLSGLIVENGKDLPVLLYECDDTWIIGGKGVGVTHRPFAWESIGSKNSGFDKCRLDHYQFGFVLIGPGYKSGDIVTNRSWEQTTGQKVLHSYVYDHSGHAFDMNGTVGCEISGCIAEKYMGTAGNSSFQIKQSTNIPEELRDGTWMNRIVGCTAIDCVTGFGTQHGMNAHFIDNQVIRAARYAAAFNSTPRVAVKGLAVDGWGMNLTAWPLQNGDTACSAVALWTGSTNCYVDDLTLVARGDHAGVDKLTGILVKGHNCTIGKMTVVKSIPAAMHSAIIISGNNTVISPEFRVASPAYYSNNAVIDTLSNAIYPLSCGLTLNVESGQFHTFDQSPYRGMIVGKIIVTPTAAPAGGTPDFSVGWVGNPAQLVSMRAAPGAATALNAAAYVPAGSILQAETVLNGTVSGQYNIRVEGVHLL